MIVLGLDQAPRFTGFCYGEPGSERPRWGTKEFSDFGNNEVPLMEEVEGWFTNLVKSSGAQVVYFEEIFVNTKRVNLPVTFKQCAVVNIIQLTAKRLGLDYWQTDIDEWRKLFIGRARAPKGVLKPGEWCKEQAKIVCLKRNWLVDDDHAAEAIGIWNWGCAREDKRHRNSARAHQRRMETQRDDEARAAR